MAPSASSSAKPGKGKLAATGGEAMGWLALGGAALAAGAALVRRARRPMRHR
ncbi:MAG TPA: LPXTG cell wall anchor domain-containing protein [Actinocrinis sp.]|nr:LPXTG cell wall anchor domain-containing protein [Actinocrinis sp.]